MKRIIYFLLRNTFFVVLGPCCTNMLVSLAIESYHIITCIWTIKAPNTIVLVLILLLLTYFHRNNGHKVVQWKKMIAMSVRTV